MRHLKEVEVKDLIGRYEAELGKLSYQAKKVQEAILELKTYLNGNGNEHRNGNGNNKGNWDDNWSRDTFGNTSLISKSPQAFNRKQSVAEVLGSNEEVDLPETGSDTDYLIGIISY